jgi:hypothetical protein
MSWTPWASLRAISVFSAGVNVSSSTTARKSPLAYTFAFVGPRPQSSISSYTAARSPGLFPAPGRLFNRPANGPERTRPAQAAPSAIPCPRANGFGAAFALRPPNQRRWRQQNGDCYNAERRKSLGPGVCRICGSEFMPTAPNQVCCPPTAEDRVRRQSGQPGSRCAKRANNLRYRHRYWPPRAYVGAVDAPGTMGSVRGRLITCELRERAAPSVRPRWVRQTVRLFRRPHPDVAGDSQPWGRGNG